MALNIPTRYANTVDPPGDINAIVLKVKELYPDAMLDIPTRSIGTGDPAGDINKLVAFLNARETTTSSAPAITSIEPSSAKPGETIILTGTGFTGALNVLFAGVGSGQFLVLSATQITVVVPAVSAGSNPVQVVGTTALSPARAFLVQAATTTGTKATAPTFGTIDDTNNIVTVTSPYPSAEVVVGMENAAGQQLASNSIFSAGNVAGRAFAYVVANSAANRLQSDTVYSAPFTSVSTNNAPTATLTVLGDITSVTPGQPVTLQVVAQDADAGDSVVKIELYDNGTKIGEIAGASGSLQTGPLTTGNHSFTAKPYDTKGAAGLSTAKLVTASVNGPAGDIISWNGQSNNQGCGNKPPLYQSPLNTVLPSYLRQYFTRIFNPKTDTLERLFVGTLEDGSGNAMGQEHPEAPSDYANGFGANIGLAQRLEQEGKTTTVFANAGRGATAIALFQKGQPYYAPALNAMLRAKAILIAEGKSPRMRAHIWNQWESDELAIVNNGYNYAAELTKLFSSLLADGGLDADTLILIIASPVAAVRAQQQAYIATNPQARLIIPEYLSYIFDGVHFDAITQLRLGNQLYNAIYGTTGVIDTTGSPTLSEKIPLLILKSWTNGNTPALWVDTSGRGKSATQPNQAAQMQLVANQINGKAVYRSTGASHFLLPAISAEEKDYLVLIAFQPKTETEGFIIDFAGDPSVYRFVVANKGDGLVYTGRDFHGSSTQGTAARMIAIQLRSGGENLSKVYYGRNPAVVESFTYFLSMLNGAGVIGKAVDANLSFYNGDLMSIQFHQGYYTDAERQVLINALGDDLALA